MKRGKSNLGDRINEKVQEDFRNIEIEYQLMSYVVRFHPQTVNLIKREWLSDVLLQIVYDAMHYVRAALTKSMLLIEMRKRSGQYDNELVEMCATDIFESEEIDDRTARHVMTQILELYESRLMLEGIGEIISEMKTFDLYKSKDKLKALSRPVSIADDINSGYYLNDYLQRIQILADKEKKVKDSDEKDVGIPTGIYKFDHVCGGILPREFGVVGGVTGVGKTLALVCFALSAWLAGYNVMLVSGEMSKDLLEFRIDSNLSGVPAMKFRNAELDDSDYAQWDSTIKKYEALQSDNFFYIVTYNRSFSTGHIENDILRVQEDSGKKLDWLGIDYLNIMNPTDYVGGGTKEWAQQADVVWDVKALTAEYNLVTWTGSQVIDAAFNKDLYDLSDIKYARAISETAPVVIALIRTDEDMLANRMRLQVLKMRNAKIPVKPIMLRPNMDIMRLHQEVQGKKTLAGMGKDDIKLPKRTKHTPPKRSKK